MPLDHLFHHTKSASTRQTALDNLMRPLLCLTRTSFVDQATKKTFQTPPTPPARSTCHSLPTLHKPISSRQDKRRGKTFDIRDKEFQVLQRQLAAYEMIEQAWEDRKRDHSQREQYMQKQLRDTHLGLVELQSLL